jgi:antitoxin VapB
VRHVGLGEALLRVVFGAPCAWCSPLPLLLAVTALAREMSPESCLPLGGLVVPQNFIADGMFVAILVAMSAKSARVFQTGGSQAIALPAEFRFSGDRVHIRRDEASGDIVISAQLPAPTWQEFLQLRAAAAGEVDDFLTERDQCSEDRDPLAVRKPKK